MDQGAPVATVPPYVFRLYVTGMTPRSVRAIENLLAICNQHLARRYELRIIDVYQQPALARTDHIIAAPTLVRLSPGPVRRVVGDLSNAGRVLAGLDLPGAES